MLKSRFWLLAGIACMALGFAACGGGGGNSSPTPPAVSVAISPETASVNANGTQQFTATVSNSTNSQVTWSASGIVGGNSTVGTITTQGLYTAPDPLPNPASATVTATSQADTTKSASASVSLMYAAPTVSAVSPTYVLVNSSDTTLTITGTNFTKASAVSFNNSALTTTFVSSTQLTAVLTYAAESAEGKFDLDVANPSPGGGTVTTPFNVYGAALTVNIIDLPAGTAASVVVTGPDDLNQTLTASQTITGTEGTYNVTAAGVTVGTSNYYATAPAQAVTLVAGKSGTITVDYYDVVPSTTKVLDQAAMNSLSVSSDGLTLTMSVSSPVAQSLSEGDIIVVPPTAQGGVAPKGMLRQVVSVSNNGSQVVAITQHGTLAEAFARAKFDINSQLSTSTIVAVHTAPGVTFQPGARLQSSSGRRLLSSSTTAPDPCGGFSLGVFDVNEPIAEDIVPGLTLNGSVEVCSGLDFSVDIIGTGFLDLIPTVNSLTATASMGAYSDLTLKSDFLDGAFDPGPTTLATLDFPPIEVPGLPVWVTPEVGVFVGANGSVTAGVTTEVSSAGTFTGGVNYSSGVWTPVPLTPSFHFGYQPPTLNAGLGAKAYAGIEFDLYVYDVVGPSFKPDGYLDLEATLTPTSSWTLTGGIEGPMSLDVSFLGETLASYDLGTMFDYSHPIASGTFTPGNGNSAPTITSLSPNSLAVGAAPQTLTINGTGFLSSSSVTYNGISHTPTLVNSGQLSITLSSSDLATAGSYPVVVTNPSPGGGASNALNFTVLAANPGPVITSLSPSSLAVGSAAQTLTIKGSNFVSSSSVNFNGTAPATTFVSSTQLTIGLTSSDLAAAGTFPVSVTNPSPGGGTSNTVNFTVSSGAVAQTETVLYSFTGPTAGGSGADGAHPISLVADSAGNLFGVTGDGGTYGDGTVFELVDSSGSYKEKDLYNFCSITNCLDGSYPLSVIIDAAGNLYGTTEGGGTYGVGTVFELIKSSGTYTEKVLSSFADTPDAATPLAGLVMDAAGNLYGTTSRGGAADTGAVFEVVNSAGNYTERVLYSLPATGFIPALYAGLAIDASRNLYAAPGNGGTNGAGYVFELVNSSGSYNEKDLYSFPCSATNCPDGDVPNGVVVDAAGNLYFTTDEGGASNGGTVFELVNSAGSYTGKVLYSFTGGSDGGDPTSGALIDSAGDLYGAAIVGGTANNGTIFELVNSATAPGTYTEKVLYSFSGSNGDGAEPVTKPIADSNGNLYGTTYIGGANNLGTVFKLSPGAGAAALKLSRARRTLQKQSVILPQSPLNGSLLARAQNRARLGKQTFVPGATAQARLIKNYGKLPLAFEANRGQADPRVEFLTRGPAYTVFLTQDRAVLALSEARNTGAEDESPLAQFAVDAKAGPSADVQMRLVGANSKARAVALDELPGKSNYLIGNDRKKWRTNVPTYAQVKYHGVYPGVDLVYYGNQGQLEYDFVVAPGAEPSVIKFNIGADPHVRPGTGAAGAPAGAPLRIAANGDLVIETGAGGVRFRKPIVYQPVAPVDNGRSALTGRPYSTDNHQSPTANCKFLKGHFVLLAKNQIGFAVASYDHTKPLVIDPVLVYSTYLGGIMPDIGIRIAVDSSGNAYVVGATMSANFPSTSGSFQPTYSGGISSSGLIGFYGAPNPNAFVAKVKPDGSGLVYATYLGGIGGDVATGIALDSSGDAYITGWTKSTNFPTTPGAFQTKLKPEPPPSPSFDSGAFVAKLNSSGSSLVYATLLGGTGKDAALGIAVDASGNAYVAGATRSVDFPTTPGAFDTTSADISSCTVDVGGGNGGMTCWHGFVTKVNPTGTGLIYSTFLGGNSHDAVTAIAVDPSGKAYVTGATLSTNFPTLGALQSLNGGGTCLPEFSQVVTRSRPCSDGFVTEFKPDGSGLVYSTYLGGNRDDAGFDIALDSSGDAYVTGITNSTNFPTTTGSLQPVFGGGTCGNSNLSFACPDAFVTKLNAAGNGLVYSTYLGGSSYDFGMGIAVDSSGDAFLVGATGSSNFPTVNPSQSSIVGACSGRDLLARVGSFSFPCPDAFVAELNASGSAALFSTFLGGSNYDAGLGIALDSLGGVYATGLTVSSNFPTANAFQPTPGGLGDAFVAKILPLAQGRVIVASPATLSFTNQSVGVQSSPPDTVVVTNTGTVTVTIASISISPANVGFAQTNNCGSALAGGASCAISVTFTPPSATSASAVLNVTDDASNSPQTVSLSGSGTSIPAGTPLAAASPASVYFGAAPVGGTSGTMTVTLEGAGNAALVLTSDPVVTGPFTLSKNTCTSGASISPGSSCTVDVTFNPTAPEVANGTLTFADNASLGTQTVKLNGAGVNAFHMCVFKGTPPDPNDQYVPPYFDKTIETCLFGCALTSTGTLLTAFDGSVTPLALDAYLVDDTTDPGYSSGQLIPNAVLGYMNNRVQLITRLTPAPGHLTVDPSALNQYLSQHVLDPKALEVVILHLCFTTDGVTCGEDHFVGVLGPTDNTMTDWNVLEPAWRTATPQASLSTLSGHLNGFIDPNGNKVQFLVLGAGGYEQSNVSSGFGVVGESPVELLITDPQGRRLGNLSSGQDVFEIPLGSYDREFLIGNDNGTSTGTDPGEASGIKIAYVPTPLDGTYTVAVTGTASGSYALHFEAVATDGSAQETTVTGTTSLGAVSTYQVSYASAPGSPFAVTKIPVGPKATFSTPQITFGGQVVNSTSAAQDVTLTNTGDSTLNISGITVSANFAETNNCGASVAAGANCTISVTFTPAAAGTLNGTLTIMDNASDSPQAIAISGAGQDFSVGTFTTAETVLPGSGTNYLLSVSPQGGFTGAVALSCTGAPAKATCTVTPSSVTLTGSGYAAPTLQVTTTAPSAVAPFGPHPPMLLWFVLIGLVGLLGATRFGRQRGAVRLALLVLAALLLVAAFWTSCGGGAAPAPHVPSGGTPAGTYTLTVTGTSGNLNHSANLSLTVQ